MSEVLPAEVVALLGPIPYLSTACQTAVALARCTDPRLPGALAAAGLPSVAGVVAAHHLRCRLTHKFTGAPCTCGCHGEVA